MRHLILILGDQLDLGAAVLRDADPARDGILMVETAGEATHVWSHRQRIAVFLAAMRHFRAALEAAGWQVHYRTLDDAVPDLATGLRDAAMMLKPERLRVTEPGEWRVLKLLEAGASALGMPLDVVPDGHFYCDRDGFDAAAGRGRLVMEHFYRNLRRRHQVLMDGDAPAGGRWNYDAGNRASFGRHGPVGLPAPRRFPPDAATQAVLADVARHFTDHPGRLDNFAWPVTRSDALAALDDFIAHRLPGFGDGQDAMWTGQPFLRHSLLSSCLNLKLLNPREVVGAAEAAWREGRAPLASAEGFIRQILGWREYVRGVYWRHMPGYAGRNHWGHQAPLPDWFWTGDVDMNCLHQAIGDTLAHGYAHHIQRLMVIGNFSVLAGLLPQAVCDWFLAAYVDAVEWVELPNTLGMALHGDGGLMATKPYISGGNYLRRMSNYCTGCRYDPAARTGHDACPFTTLYWDFLRRHRATLARNPRMRTVLGNLDRFGPDGQAAIAARATEVRARYAPLFHPAAVPVE
ncbi:MAG: cryptochrome/photolyase family protein [Chromatiales bacterium]|nr:cryptochrome/photolyase family protein [Chromatiales bacterium]